MLTLNLQISVLLLVYSFGEGNFKLCIRALKGLAPLFFSLAHYNCARRLFVHIRDLAHPDVMREFKLGKFVVRKAICHFSGIATDHAHEQNSECVKGDGGAIRLSKCPAQPLKWMVAGPELARTINEFERPIDRIMGSSAKNATEASRTGEKQTSFIRKIRSPVGTIESMGNPFCDITNDLIVIDIREVQ